MSVGLLIVYSMGLLIGILLYALTVYFSKDIAVHKRSLWMLGFGILVVVAGLFVGGFEGMAVSMTGAGIITVSGLLFITKRNLLLRKMVIAVAIIAPLVIFTYTGYNKNVSFTVAAKDENMDKSLKDYYTYLQKNSEIRGFRILDANEGEKAISLSLGREKKGNSIEVKDIKRNSGNTIINIRSFENQSTEENPTVIFIIENYKPNNSVIIKDTDGTVYPAIK